MAVNSFARRLAWPIAMATVRQPKRRLAPRPQDPATLPARPQDAATSAGPQHGGLSPVAGGGARDIRPPLQTTEGIEVTAEERSWLGAPKAFRLPNVSLPRLTLPRVGTPHWSLKVPSLPVAELTELGSGAAQLLTLWNGPNVEDIRRFERSGTEPHSYGWFQNLLTQSALLKTDEAREEFLQVFSAYGAPKLTDELAALEYFCMKTAYLKLQPGDRQRFCCADYGWQTVVASIRDYQTGLVAHVMVPDEAPVTDGAELGAKPPVLVIFRGTARVSTQPEADFAERPTGCQADLDWDGIGFHAFAANRDVLLSMVRKYMSLGHRVVLAGHSLGGVFASRTMCALAPDEQQQALLRTFNASGLDPATRMCAVVPENNIMVRHRDDKLPRAGGELPDGTLITTVPQSDVEALYPHGMPLLAANGLNGRAPLFTAKMAEPSDMSPTLEMGRKFLCLVAHDRVEI